MLLILIYILGMEPNSCVFWSLDILKILAPLPIGFAVFLVHLATIPITGTGINPARSLGAAIIYNKDHAWGDHVSSLFNHINGCTKCDNYDTHQILSFMGKTVT